MSETKTNIVTATKKVNIIIGQREHELKTCKIFQARETANDQVMIGFSFASNWIRGWCEFSGPIRELSYGKTKPILDCFRHSIENFFMSKLGYQSEPIPIVGQCYVKT